MKKKVKSLFGEIGPLGRKHLLYVIVFSTIFTIITNSIQLYIEYQKDVAAIEKVFTIIEKSYLPALAASRYYLDNDQLNLLIDGISILPNIEAVEFLDENGKTIINKSLAITAKRNNILSKSYQIIYSDDNVQRKVGHLKVHCGLNQIIYRLKNNIFIIIITNTMKIFIVSFLIVIIIHFFTIRHLKHITKYFETVDPNKQNNLQLNLNRSRFEFRGTDELDNIVDAINSMTSRINSSYEQLKKNEKSLLLAFNEKETLLREVYHRTKNNMQIIQSMLLLQANQTPKNIDVQNLVKVTQNRIYSMSLVHKMLYQSQDLTHIDLKKYLEKLTTHTLQSYRDYSKEIFTNFNIDNVILPLETAVPLGLIVAELLMNAVTHGFLNQNSGTITIESKFEKNESLILSVSDNGSGIDSAVDLRRQESLGLKIIYSIIEDQLHGTVNFKTANGVKCIIKIPIAT